MEMFVFQFFFLRHNSQIREEEDALLHQLYDVDIRSFMSIQCDVLELFFSFELKTRADRLFGLLSQDEKTPRPSKGCSHFESFSLEGIMVITVL